MTKIGHIMVIGAFSMLLAGCTQDANRGYTRLRPDAVSFDQADRTCWVRTMGAPMAGPSTDAARDRAYAACMRELGWEDQRRMF